MSAIQNLSEPWKGHTHKEVEDFVKSELEGGGGAGATVVEFVVTNMVGSFGVGSVEMYARNRISNEELLSALLAGPVHAICKSDPTSGPEILLFAGELSLCASTNVIYDAYVYNKGCDKYYTIRLSSGCGGHC